MNNRLFTGLVGSLIVLMGGVWLGLPKEIVGGYLVILGILIIYNGYIADKDKE